MHCNIHQADRPLNAVLRESFWQQQQGLRLNGGAGTQGKAVLGQQQVHGAMEARTRLIPGLQGHRQCQDLALERWL